MGDRAWGKGRREECEERCRGNFREGARFELKRFGICDGLGLEVCFSRDVFFISLDSARLVSVRAGSYSCSF